jgi:hypothetical protein
LIDAYLEIGTRRVFALAVDWPGWARAGRDEESAVASLVAYRPRYVAAVGDAGAELPDAVAAADVRVVERVAGGSSTDFGAPGSVPVLDADPVSETELERLIGLHAACWSAFSRTVAASRGAELAAAGPRGGGRALNKIEQHVGEAEAAYVSSVGGARPSSLEPQALRAALAEAVRERNAGLLPATGPRGGRRWPARYGIRRSSWHLLDHAWEIEDRTA